MYFCRRHNASNNSLQNGAKVFIKFCSRFSYLKNLNILKTRISRSIASMTEYHSDLAKVFHEQNVENYSQNWDVKEYAYA